MMSVSWVGEGMGIISKSSKYITLADFFYRFVLKFYTCTASISYCISAYLVLVFDRLKYSRTLTVDHFAVTIN